jgi:hypothetical protein
MDCPNCHTRNQAYATFCLECGEALGEAAERRKRVVVRTEAEPEVARRTWTLPTWWRGGLALLVVGGLVVVLVVQSVQSWLASDYRAGQKAASAHQWEQAQAAFTRAGTYADAPAQASTAVAQIETRDRLYAAGQQAAAEGDWPGALDSWQKAATIQPGYRDLTAQIKAAQATLAARAPAGLVYRTSGAEAGLYLQGPTDRPAARLPGSDDQSILRGIAYNAQTAVYDVAGEGGRALRLATLDPLGGKVWTAPPLPAWLPPDGSAVFGAGGFWWTAPVEPRLSFYDLTLGTLKPITLPLATNLIALNQGPGNLLLESLDEQTDGPHSHLLVAWHDGSNLRVLDEAPGSLDSAAISPDGRWVLYQRTQAGALKFYSRIMDGNIRYGTTWQTGRADAITTRLLLRWIDPDDRTLPLGPDGRPVAREQILDTLVTPDDTGPAGGRISAAFAPRHGALIVINHVDQAGRTITTVDASTGLQTTFRPDAAPLQALDGPFFSPQGTCLQVVEQAAGGARVRLRPLDGQGTDRLVPVTAPAGSIILSQVTLREDTLLILVGPPTSTRRNSYTLTRLPLADPTAHLLPVFDALYGRPGVGEPLIRLAPSGNALTYVRPNGRLLVVPLDGSPPQPLAENVIDVWSPVP